jgi:hypothetical protein
VVAEICVTNFEYLLISSQKGVNGYPGLSKNIDGILGMSRDIVPVKINYTV